MTVAELRELCPDLTGGLPDEYLQGMVWQARLVPDEFRRAYLIEHLYLMRHYPEWFGMGYHG